MNNKALAVLLASATLAVCTHSAAQSNGSAATAPPPPWLSASRPAGSASGYGALRPLPQAPAVPDYLPLGSVEEDRELNAHSFQRFPAESAWLTREKARHAKLLAKGRFDVLVLPFQIAGLGLDRSNRTLMASELAMALSQTGKLKVADPLLVGKALGEGQRHYRMKDVYALANSIGARRIVLGEVGHSEGRSMHVTLKHQDRGDAPVQGDWQTPMSRRQFTDMTISGGVTPLELYESKLPNLLEALGVATKEPVFVKQQHRLELQAVPESPLALLPGQDNPATHAYVFFALRAMTPRHMEREQERFAQKAWLALLRLHPSSPDYRALRARGLHAMGYRPAALKLLEQPRTDEEQELVAVLNGNLPEVARLAAREPQPLKRLLQKLDENTIASAYGLRTGEQSLREAEALRLPGKVWPLLAARAFTDTDIWSAFDNAALKAVLDQDLPLDGTKLPQLLSGARLLGGDDRALAAADLSVLEHAAKLAEARANTWCCAARPEVPDAQDYLALLQAMADDNLLRRISQAALVRGAPESAMASASQLEPVYQGHPYYLLARAQAEAALATRRGGIEAQGLLKAAGEHAADAAFWEQGQSGISAAAANLPSQIRGLRQTGWPVRNFYATDLPFHANYAVIDGGSYMRIEDVQQALLDSACWDFTIVPQLDYFYRTFAPKSDLRAKLYAQLETRFIGSPQRNALMATYAQQSGDTSKTEALLRNNLRNAPDTWEAYRDLGMLLLETGKPKDAAQVFMGYSGFKDRNAGDPVAQSIHALEAGTPLYWTGHFDLAEPLYRTGVSRGTGSASEMLMQLRLGLLASDIPAATREALRLAQRYRDMYAYREYLGLLFASGRGKTAWEGFDTLVAQDGATEHLWESALAGHHKDGASETSVLKWAQQARFANLGGYQGSAAMYLARFATTDRTPSKTLADQIDQLDHPVWRMDEYQGFAVRPTADGQTAYIVGPRIQDPRSTLPLRALAGRKTRVRSDLAYFAQAYRDIQLRDFAAAKAALEEAARLYDLSTYASYMLPYYALVSARMGDTAGVNKVLERIEPENQRFDYHLAMAAIQAQGGKTDDALKSLALSRYRRAPTGKRPLLTHFTYGDVAGQLASMTGNAALRDVALQWARAQQRAQPWLAWSHAMVAELSTDSAERKRAIATVRYLDPQSERLARFKPAEVAEAVKAFGQSHPFAD